MEICGSELTLITSALKGLWWGQDINFIRFRLEKTKHGR